VLGGARVARLALGSVGFSVIGLVWLFVCLSESQFLFNNLLILNGDSFIRVCRNKSICIFFIKPLI
jgi:hypothetical protein